MTDFAASDGRDETESGFVPPDGSKSSAPPIPNAPMTVARLLEWVRGAQPGARQTLGYGADALSAYSYAVRDAVNALTAAGWITPHVVRLGPGRSARIAQRSSRAMLKGERLPDGQAERRAAAKWRG